MQPINAGDTAFVLMSAALVALMTPGLAFFYGGLVRRKNFLAIMMQSFISMGVVTVIWVSVGYSLAFSGDIGGVIGNLDWAFLRGVGQAPGPWAPTIPAQAHFVFQEMFAIITPALITGAFADRVRFKSYLKFLVAWSLLVYVPAGALDLGRRVPRAVGRARLRRRAWSCTPAPASPPWRRCGWSGARKFAPRREAAAAQRGVRRPRHRAALVRLVRLQRRLGAGGQRHRGAGVRQHRHRRVDRDVHVAVHQLAAGREAEPGRRVHRRGGRARRASRRARATCPTWAAFIIGLLAGSVCYGAVHVPRAS